MHSRRIWASAVFGVAALAGDTGFHHGRLFRNPLHNAGELVLVDVAIDTAVISPRGSTITVGGEVVFNGPFSGAASFHGGGTAVFNGGSSPGDSPALVPVEGSVRFGPANTLTIDLGTTTLGDFDRLEVQGGVEAGGALVVSLLPTFAGNLGDSYEIVTAAIVTGAFTYTPPNIGSGVILALEQTTTSIRLTVAGDCNGNGLADTQEIAQGGDSNSNGFLDTCEVSRLDVSRTDLSWTPLSIATTYDVFAGYLETLRTTGGNFTTATASCFANNQSGATLPDTTAPAPGTGFWLLVRGVAGPVNLSLDEFTAGQIGSRDAEVAASVAPCQ